MLCAIVCHLLAHSSKGLFELQCLYSFEPFEIECQAVVLWHFICFEASTKFVYCWRITWIRLHLKLFVFRVVSGFFAFFSFVCNLSDLQKYKIIWLYRGTTSANGCVLIFVYMTYTMLPVRLREALFGGMLLSVVHVYLTTTCSRQVNWSEVFSLESTI